MPFYQLRNKKTRKIIEKEMTISEGDAWELANPGWERVCGAPGIGDAMKLGVGPKPSDSFRERIRDIKKLNYKSTIQT